MSRVFSLRQTASGTFPGRFSANGGVGILTAGGRVFCGFPENGFFRQTKRRVSKAFDFFRKENYNNEV
jgi:hypothetical protein